MKTKQKRKNPVNATILCRVLRKENQRLREELNEQTAYADEYHATITELWQEMERLAKYRLLEIGKMSLSRTRSGKLWLQINGAEGMEVDEKKFEKALHDFMAKHF